MAKRKAPRPAAPSLGSVAAAIVAERRAQARPWFTATLAKPPSVNALYRNPTRKDGRKFGRIPTKAYAIWKKGAIARLLSQRPPQIAGAYDLRIELGRRKGSDLGNYEKALSDLLQTDLMPFKALPLQGFRVVENDSLCERIEITWADDLRANECRVHVRAHVRVTAPAQQRVRAAPVLGVDAGFLDKLDGTQFKPETAPKLKKKRARKIETAPAWVKPGLFVEKTDAGEQVSLVADPKPGARTYSKPERKSLRPSKKTKKGRAR